MRAPRFNASTQRAWSCWPLYFATLVEKTASLPHPLPYLKGIEKLVNLKELELRGNGLTDVKSLEDLTKLEILFLTSNKLTNVSYIGNLKNLKVLALENNELTDVKGLEKLTKLEWLYLENNNLTKAQIAELQKALPNCKIYPKEKSK